MADLTISKGSLTLRKIIEKNKTMQKKIGRIFISTFVIFSLMFLFIGFVEFQWNPFLMSQDIRTGIVATTLVFSTIYNFFKLINDGDL